MALTDSGASAGIEALRRSLGELPEPVAKPIFVFVSGLPGTGKSYLSRNLAQRLPVAVLETDSLRKLLWPDPIYSGEESARLFYLVHLLIQNLLQSGICVLLDATNLQERHREHLYSIAEQVEARIIIVRTQTSDEAVQARLKARATEVNREDNSSADWQVYQRMRSSVERIGRPHYTVDTSQDIEPVLQKIFREARRWMKV